MALVCFYSNPINCKYDLTLKINHVFCFMIDSVIVIVDISSVMSRNIHKDLKLWFLLAAIHRSYISTEKKKSLLAWNSIANLDNHFLK